MTFMVGIQQQQTKADKQIYPIMYHMQYDEIGFSSTLLIQWNRR